MKKRDPSIYDSGKKFFDDSTSVENSSKEKKEKKEKKVFLKDAEIQFAMAEASTNGEIEEFSTKKPSEMSLVEEREEIKKKFSIFEEKKIVSPRKFFSLKKALQSSDDEDGETFLKKKIKTEAEKVSRRKFSFFPSKKKILFALRKKKKTNSSNGSKDKKKIWKILRPSRIWFEGFQICLEFSLRFLFF